MNKKKIRTTAAGAVAVAVALGLGSMGVKGEDAISTTAISASTTGVERPPRPENQPGQISVSALNELLKSFEEQKRDFMKQQKEQQAESRRKARAELHPFGGAGGAKREAKDSIEEAKQVSREQARKLGEEAREAAKEIRKRR